MRSLVGYAVMLLLLVDLGGDCCRAQGCGDGIGDITRLLGVSSPENIDAVEVERLQDMLSNPLKVNFLSFEKLVDSGLFSTYQAASLLDYRENHGDVMSIYELGAVDGIGNELAERIAPFVSLDGSIEWGKKRVRTEMKARSGFKCHFDGHSFWSAGVRSFVDFCDVLSAGLSYSKTLLGELVPESVAGNIVWYAPRASLKLIVGDYNARFGQGLALFNGMGMNGLSSPASLVKRSTGLSPSTSFSAAYSLTGVALQHTGRHFRFSAGLSFPGVRRVKSHPESLGFMPLADFTLFVSDGQLSLTGYLVYTPFSNNTPPAIGNHYYNRTLTDAKISIANRWTLNGTELFAEVSYDWVYRTPAALAGLSFKLFDALRLAGMIRYYPQTYSTAYSTAVRSRTKCSNEHSISLTGEFSCSKYISLDNFDPSAMPLRRHSLTFYSDFSHIPKTESSSNVSGHQLKSGLTWQYVITKHFLLKLKTSHKYRSWGDRNRAEVRADFNAYYNHFHGVARIHTSICKKMGVLGYLECGYKGSQLGMYLRTGVFFIDSWQDRIYVYERDAPGTFNVPAFYGRGVWTALTGAWKFAKWGKLYVRMGATAYPFNGAYSQKKKKPGSAELKLQMNISF